MEKEYLNEYYLAMKKWNIYRKQMNKRNNVAICLNTIKRNKYFVMRAKTQIHKSASRPINF